MLILYNLRKENTKIKTSQFILLNQNHSDAKIRQKKTETLNIILIIDRKTFGKILDDRIQVYGSGRSPRERNGNPLQYPLLENLMDRGALQAAVHVVTKELDTTQQINNNPSHCSYQILILFMNKPHSQYFKPTQSSGNSS